jgi:phage minor structural protein
VALIHILDRQTDEIIGTLNVGQYKDDRHRMSVDNLHTFDFKALKQFDKLQKRNRLLLQDIDGFFHEFIIEYAEQFNRTEKTIYANASYLSLQKAKVIEPQTLAGTTARLAAELALSGTEFEVGFVEVANIRTLVISEYTNPYKLLKMIASEFGAELRFRIVVDGNRIVGRYVDILKPKEEFDGKETVFGKDLVGLRRKEDSQNIVTALLGIGPEREDGTRLTVFVEDQDALQRWGRKGKHLIDIYEPETTDSDMTLERLTTLTTNELEKRIDSLVEYECDASVMEHLPNKEHEKVRLGNTVRIKDDGYEPPLYLEARVMEVIYQPSQNKISSFKLGNYKEYKKEELEAQIKLLKELLKQKASNAELQTVYESALQQAEEKANRAETNAKVYADTVSQEAESNAKSHADVVSQQAENNAKSHADSVAEQKKLEAINAAIADAETKINAAKTELEADIALKADAEWVNGQLVLKENAIHRGTTAPTDTTKLWLDTSVVPNVLKRYDSATSSWVKATPTSAGEVGAYTKTEVDNALNSKVSVTTYTADKNGIISRLDSAESRITQNEQEIATKVSNTTYQQDKTAINNNISDLQTRMSNAETSITQNASQIALKANKTDVYTKTEIDGQFSTVNQQISQMNAELIVQADQISQRVTKTEFLSNIPSDSSFERGTELWSESNSFSSNVDNVNATVKKEGLAGGNVLELTGTKWVYFKNPIPVDTSRVYRVGFRVRQIQDTTVGDSRVYAGVATYDKNGNLQTTSPGTHRYCAVAGVKITVAEGWRYFEGIITGEGNTSHNQFRPGTAYVKPTFIVNYNGGNGVAQVDLVEFKDITEEVNAKNYTDNSLQPVNTRLTTAETSITQLSDQIQLKANKSEVDTLAGRMTNAESSINILTNQIELKANQSTVDSLTNRISSAESSINLLSNQIDLKVDVDGVISAINLSQETVKISAERIEFEGHVFGSDATFNGIVSSKSEDLGGWSQFETRIMNGKILTSYNTGLGPLITGELSPDGIKYDIRHVGEFVINDTKIEWNDNFEFPEKIYSIVKDATSQKMVLSAPNGVQIKDVLINNVKSMFNGNTILHDHGNGNASVSAAGGDLYLGYSNTNKIYTSKSFQVNPTLEVKQDILLGGTTTSPNGRFIADGTYLYIQPKGTEVRVVNTFTTATFKPIRASNFITDTSIRENKKDIEEFEDSALEGIRNAKVYTYRRKTDEPDAFKQLGLMVDDTPRILHGPAGDSFDLYALSAYIFKGVKELDSKFMSLEDEINWLRMENQYLKQKIEQLEAKIL